MLLFSSEKRSSFSLIRMRKVSVIDLSFKGFFGTLIYDMISDLIWRFGMNGSSYNRMDSLNYKTNI